MKESALRWYPSDEGFRSERPRVGVVSDWFDPNDPNVWSGVPFGIISELRRLGLFAGTRSAIPWFRGARVARRLCALTNRPNWPLGFEMRALARASDRLLRFSAPKDVEGWIHFVGSSAPISRSRYVTLYEMSPQQLLEGERLWPGTFGYPGASRSQLSWVARRQELLYKRASAVCVASRWAADSLVGDHGIKANKIHVIGYGRNVERSAPASRDWSTPRFLFVGRDWQRKNGDAVVRAFVEMRRRIPVATLDIVGFHPPIDAEGVFGHGPIDRLDPRGGHSLEDLFAAATCFILPSFMEPFGIVYVEAGSAGLASIATRIGGTADSVGPGGICVDPYDDDEILNAMMRLADPGTAREMGSIARERSARFTWPAVTERVLTALELPVGAAQH